MDSGPGGIKSMNTKSRLMMSGETMSNCQAIHRETMRVVEDCLAIDVNELMRLGIVVTGERHRGRFEWYNLMTARVIGDCYYDVDCTRPEVASAVFTYTLRELSQQLALIVFLTSTRPTFGGLRWWFRCPIKDSRGYRCENRVGKLYLPPGDVYFGCRECHRLTYTSHQSHKCGLGMLRRMAAHSGQDIKGVRGMLKPQTVIQRV